MVKLIHKSELCFDLLTPLIRNKPFLGHPKKRMHPGELYIYNNRIYIHDDSRWYLADINDILDIKSKTSHKQLIIQFWNYDLILFCKDYSHLLALRDFLLLIQDYPITNEISFSNSGSIGGCE